MTTTVKNKVSHEYATMIAERLLEASKNASYTHATKSLGEGILRNIQVLNGEIEKPPVTSLGDPGFLDYQVEWAERKLKAIAEGLS